MRFYHSLGWRIVLAYTGLIFIAMGAVSLYLVDFVRDSYMSSLEERLKQEAGLVAETATPYFRGPLDPAGLQVVSQRMSNLIDARVTLIARDGTVLADTWEDPTAMDNHRTRPEVQSALSSGLGLATRVSATVGQELLYTAVPIHVEGTGMGVARVAVPVSQVQDNVNRIISTIALSALVVAFFSIALGYFLARRTSRSVRTVAEAAHRLAAGDLEHRVEALASDETQELATAFNWMATALRDIVRDLSGERNKLVAVLDTMADGVVVIQPGGEIGLLNRAAEGLLDLPGARAAPVRFMEAVRDHELQGLVSRALETQRQQQGEVELFSQRRTLSAIATPLSGDGSAGVLLTLHDLTRMRRVETTRKEFVSNVSHELRTPLASVKAMVETLEDSALDEPAAARDFVRRIHGEIDRMSAMVAELLELARLESGPPALHPAPLQLDLLVREVKGQFEAQAQAKGIVMEATIPDTLPRVWGAPEKLRAVLGNLLDNGLKFTPAGGKVTIAARVEGRYVAVSVSDTGIGIAPEHLPHIFERFYKVDHSRRDEGTGLGLAIVKHIVQAHGGEVRVESREGMGSTFTFTLPRAT
ncbi:MAG: HAMP domain-containing protein [Chloroflexi bacterium]|nr:HAMP domain-containing protein [Chloroflexota bacterium]